MAVQGIVVNRLRVAADDARDHDRRRLGDHPRRGRQRARPSAVQNQIEGLGTNILTVQAGGFGFGRATAGSELGSRS